MPVKSDPSRPTLVGTRGAIATSHWLASASGMAVLERGGNVFDAATAAAFVLQVVEPHQNGPGGDVSLLMSAAKSEAVEVICGQGPAPEASTIARFEDLGLSLIPDTGLLPACVPGAVDAWLRLLEENGTMELGDVLSDAIAYAADGYPVSAELRQAILRVKETFTNHWPSSAAVYLRRGVPTVGELLSNPTLARTLRRLVEEARGNTREARVTAARRMWYQGFVAEEIEAFVVRNEVMDEIGQRHRGLITAQDLTKFEARRESPVSFRYRDYVVYKTPSWGQGPVFLQQLALLDGYDLPAVGLNSTEYIHLVIECSKLAFADREAWYGDPEFCDIPIDELLSGKYAAGRRTLVGDEASSEFRPGSPLGRSPRLPVFPEPTRSERDAAPSSRHQQREPSNGDTCFVAISDNAGNVLAAAPSGGWLYGSPVIPNLGFCLGTRAQMFWLQKGLPNSLAPRKRPRTTLSPTIAMAEGERRLAFGTPGGDQQDQWSLLFFLNFVNFGLDLQQSIDTPVFHSLHFPNSFYPRDSYPAKVVVEGRIIESVVQGLRQRGHEVEVAGAWDLARTCAVSFDGRASTVGAGASIRGLQAHAVVR